MLQQMHKKKVDKKLQEKRGVSVIIGYVLLIVVAVVLGGIMYTWMKSYVPTDKLECPEGSSILIENYTYNCSTGIISFSIKNNGRFEIGGYFIKATNSSNQSVATIDLTKYLVPGSGGLVLANSIKLGPGVGSDNSFAPNDQAVNSFNVNSSTGIGTIYKVEIVAFRWQKENNKLRFVSCGAESNTKENIICS